MKLTFSTRSGRLTILILAVLSALGGWYYGALVAPAGMASIHEFNYCDLIPRWFGAREILLNHGNPYAAKVNADIQMAMYGAVAPAGVDQQGYAYPVFFAFLFAPYALLPLASAIKLATISFAIFTAISVYWWAEKPSLSMWLTITLLVGASYPFYLALDTQQPTLMMAPILAASYAAARSWRLGLSGFLLALASAKPQLAIAVGIAMALWALQDLRNRKSLLIACATTEALLFAASEYFSPHWIGRWLQALQAYKEYAKADSLIASFTGTAIANVLSILVLIATGYILWIRRENLAFTVAFSVAAFSLVIPFHIYDEILLLAPIVWLVFHHEEFDGWTSRILLAGVKVALCLGWICTAAISLLSLISTRVALVTWEFPLGLVGMLPITIFLALGHYGLYQRYRLIGRDLTEIDSMASVSR